ncbi:Mu-like prophage major head subunit gpT family protein [Desulfitobacterium sp.]|uniref:Mu-like prophage major head subunit gpT family protein n=1 Tax=Desulfitobacterium sp. TaxID=49981 RepID=UPI002CF8822B|nr:Mu-like prophage major head subunit gpT family protein [Desulfitobacterium sp.]HVJ50049.1 Mu-like prophage major head subunit gpT family protein [Desulfitobacterium sp.]
MIINQAAINDIYSSFNTVFNKTLEETTVLHPKIAMEVPSEASDENYGWLGSMPSMREWVGDRQIRNVAVHTYAIKNKLFEKTISVSRNDIEDDRIGVYKPMFQDLAEGARKLPDKLVFGLLPRAFADLCYDKKPFISNVHPYLYSITKSGKTQSNKGTDKLTPDSYGIARAAMMSLTNDEGEPLYIIPDLLVVSPQNDAAARRIAYAELINNETNIYKGTAEVLVAPELVNNPDMWFLLCTSKAIKPFIFQNRRKPALVAKTAANDDNVFFGNEYLYGVDTRCNAGCGLWQLAYGSDGTTTGGV